MSRKGQAVKDVKKRGWQLKMSKLVDGLFKVGEIMECMELSRVWNCPECEIVRREIAKT